jgi:hypothetical protein
MNKQTIYAIWEPSETPKWWQWGWKKELDKIRRNNLRKSVTFLNATAGSTVAPNVRRLPNRGEGIRLVCTVPNVEMWHGVRHERSCPLWTG